MTSNVIYPAVCRVDSRLSIVFMDQRWSVFHIKPIRVGDLIICLPGPDGVLYVLDVNGLLLGTSALSIEPAHSRPHMSLRSGIPANSGSLTTSNAPDRGCSSPGTHAANTLPQPRSTNHVGRKRNRTLDTANGEPAADSISIASAAALEPNQLLRRRMKGRRKSRASLHISIRVALR